MDILLLLRKAVSAETSFHPDIVYAVRETSLKYIGKSLLLFCQYKPCLHEGALPPLLPQSRSPVDRLTYIQRNSPDFRGASTDLSWYKCEIDTGPLLILWHLNGILKNHKSQCCKNRQKILTHSSLRPIKINNDALKKQLLKVSGKKISFIEWLLIKSEDFPPKWFCQESNFPLKSMIDYPLMMTVATASVLQMKRRSKKIACSPMEQKEQAALPRTPC